MISGFYSVYSELDQKWFLISVYLDQNLIKSPACPAFDIVNVPVNNGPI